MRKNKLMKFAELENFPFVFESFDAKNPGITDAEGHPVAIQGLWHETVFNNENPIVLELACGGGEYTVSLAGRYPNKNFIGVDIKGARIWKGARRVDQLKLENAAFLRTRIERIAYFFAKDEVSEIWITFPDPFIKKSKSNRRLTSPYFLKLYSAFLKPGAILHLKTDSDLLYEFSLVSIRECPFTHVEYHCNDIYAGPLENDDLEIKTFYEKQHLEEGKTIKYLRCVFS